MGLQHRVEELKLILGGLLASLKPVKNESLDYPIDFVVTWVDGNDPVWQKERAETLGLHEYAASGNGVCRYRDWSSFRYWFRAVETYAPWVRYVHLVTWGHVPEWLKLDCPKLRIVNHKDYVPAEYLPTFNCQPLELNLFRIPDLSEHFVYFNDDMLLHGQSSLLISSPGESHCTRVSLTLISIVTTKYRHIFSSILMAPPIRRTTSRNV